MGLVVVGGEQRRRCRGGATVTSVETDCLHETDVGIGKGHLFGRRTTRWGADERPGSGRKTSMCM